MENKQCFENHLCDHQGTDPDEEKDSSQNVSSLAIWPDDVAATPRKFYWI